MDLSEAVFQIKEYLGAMPLATIRVLGRHYGAPKASSLAKDDLIAMIADIVTGQLVPPPPSKRGAPPKQNYIDPQALTRLEEIRRAMLRPERPVMVVESGEPYRNIYNETVYVGLLEITQGGYGFLRSKNCQPSAVGDVFLPAPVIHANKLREGDKISCTAKPRNKNDSPAVDVILSVNEKDLGEFDNRPMFDDLTAKYAQERITLSEGNDDIALRMLDLFTPIGKGQRALIIAPPKAGKTTLLKSMARSIYHNHRELVLIVLLIDERPEEVTDIRESVPNAEVVYSTFDEGAEHHIRAAELTLAHAKRMAEIGKDVIVLLDSITKLTRAYNTVGDSTGKTLTGGLDAGAFTEPKRFFGAARNTVEAGSLTIVATALVDTGSRMDEVIYEEFKGTGNSDIFLSRELAEKRVFPAIDVGRSGTRKEELLLSEEELAAVYKLRERGLTSNVAGLIETMKRTQNNAEFVARLPEWLKVYKA